MKNPIKSAKVGTPAVTTGLDIVGQGHVPGATQQDVPVPSAPSKGDMKARGFGAMLRSQMFKVR